MARPNLFVRSSKRLLILAVLFLIGLGFWDNLRGAIYVLIPSQVEALFYQGLHYLAQGLNLISPQPAQGVFWGDWLLGGLLIGWFIPSLLFILVCLAGYFTTIYHPRRTRGKPPLDFPLLQERISKAYWRAKFMDLERTSFAVLAVGGVLFLILSLTRVYFIERFPFAGGATLLCFIGYSYIFNIHFLFFKGNSPRKVIGLIDSRLQLRQGLLTLWDNKQFNQPSPLALVLAKRVQEKLKRFKPELIFPHRLPRLNRYNFLFPLLIISCLSISSALALPQIQNSLRKYLHSGIITSNKITSSPAKRSTLEDNLLQQGKELKQLSQQLAKLNNPNLTPMAVPSMRNLGNELISLSKQNKNITIMAGKNAHLPAGDGKRNKGETLLDEAERDILQSLMEKQIAAAQYRLDSNPIPLSKTLKHALTSSESLPSIDKKSQLSLQPRVFSQRLKGKISSQLRKLAQEMLALKLVRGGAATGRPPTTVKTGTTKPRGKKSAKGRGDKIKAISSKQDYQKAKAVLAQLDKFGENASQPQASMKTGGQGGKSKEQQRKEKPAAGQKGRQNKAAAARKTFAPNDNTPPVQTAALTATGGVDSPTTDKPENDLAASRPSDEKQKAQETKGTTDKKLASNKMDPLDSSPEENELEAPTTKPKIPLSYLRVVPLIKPPEVNYQTNAPPPSVLDQINSLGNRIQQIGERRDTTIVSSGGLGFSSQKTKKTHRTKLGSSPSKTGRNHTKQIGERRDTTIVPSGELGFSNQKTRKTHRTKLGSISPKTDGIARGGVPALGGSHEQADGSNARRFPPADKKQLPEIISPTNIEIAPSQALQALPDEYFEWYTKKWEEEGEAPQLPANAPLKEKVQERIQVSAKRLELLGTRMMLAKKPRQIKLSSKQKEKLAELLRKNIAAKAAPGGKETPAFSSAPDPTHEYQKQAKIAANELQEILLEAKGWTAPGRNQPPDKPDNSPREQTLSGGTGSRGHKAVVVSGQNPSNKTNDLASVRLQSFPIHKPTHNSLTNLSREVGISSQQTMPGTPQHLSFQRQARVSGTSMTNSQNVRQGNPNVEQLITQQRQGLKQITEALNNAATPDKITKISQQLADIAKAMEISSLQLSQAARFEAKGKNKRVSSEQPMMDTGPAKNPGQRFEMIPPDKHQHSGSEAKQPSTTYLMPNKMDKLKQVRKDDTVIKGKGNLQVNKTPSQLTTGSAGLSEIAAQFKKLRIKVLQTNQSGRLKEISQEMMDLANRLDPGGSKQMFLAGVKVSSGKKITGKHIVKGDNDLKPAAKLSTGKFVYPELGSIKAGKTLAQLKKRETLSLPQEFKKELDQLKGLNKKLEESKEPEQIRQAAKEILHFSQQLYGLTPKREEKTLAILKEGVKRQGEKIKQLSKKLSRTKNPQKIAGYALELSRHAANLKTLGDKSEALGWKEAKGLRKYADKLEQTAKLLTKKTQGKQKTDSLAGNNYQKMALRRNAQRIKELSQIIVTSKEVKKVQKSAKELLKLSRELNDIHHNLGVGKARSSFAPQARNTAQEAVRKGGAKLQQLLRRIKEQQGNLQLDDIGLQLKSIASNLKRVGRKKLSKQEGVQLKKVSEDLLQIAAQLKRQGASSSPKRRSSNKRTTGREKTGAIRDTSLNQILPRLAQHADKLSKMKLADKDNSGQAMNTQTLNQLQLGSQETVAPERLLQIASQIKGLGEELLKAPLQRDTPTPSQRSARQQGQANFPGQTGQDQLALEKNLLEMKKQLAVQKLDAFLDEFSKQQQMGAYSVRNVSVNTSGEGVISTVSKGEGGNRQSLFSKGQRNRNPTAQGGSMTPLSEDIDNPYPMQEDLAGDKAFASIITRVKRYRDKLASTPLNVPKSSLARLSDKGEKQRTSPRQAKLPTNLRRETIASKGERSIRRSNIGPKEKTLRRKAPVASSASQPAKVIEAPQASSFELPVTLKNVDQSRISFKSRRPKTQIEAKQKLVAQQDAAASVTRSRIPPEYQNIFKRIYLYFQDFSSQPKQTRQ